jgi:hypothetical protein
MLGISLWCVIWWEEGEKQYKLNYICAGNTRQSHACPSRYDSFRAPGRARCARPPGRLAGTDRCRAGCGCRRVWRGTRPQCHTAPATCPPAAAALRRLAAALCPPAAPHCCPACLAQTRQSLPAPAAAEPVIWQSVSVSESCLTPVLWGEASFRNCWQRWPRDFCLL